MQSDPSLLLTWVPRLRRYARALVRNIDDADDLVQDTLERALSKTFNWGDVRDMRAWLFSIKHNLHVDRIRKPALHMVAADETTPEIAIMPTQDERLIVMDLQTAIDQLPVDYKEVLLMVALEDMSYSDVAKALSIPQGTVMSRLSRGRERLRALMDGRPAEPAILKVIK